MRRLQPVARRRIRLAVALAAVVLAVVLTACPAAPPQDADPEAAPREAAADPTAGWELDWARDAVFYEIFVRSFADSDGDGIGDLPGLTARLDYLNDGDPTTDDDLGVTGIWLMPVFASPSYHGYDVVDYRTINPDYGTNEDFDAFLAAAHERGIRVIVDLVLNHTSSQHPWFVEARQGPDAAHRDWYVWRDDDPGWTQPWGGTWPTWHENEADGTYYYGIFWGGMPDLNFRNPAVRREMEDVASYWLSRGVDGFRLDAARHIVADGPGAAQNDTPETHAWWREFADRVRDEKPSALLVGENWTDAEHIAPYFAELPMNFNFPLSEGLVAGLKADDAAPVADALAAMAEHYPEGALPAVFLTNHDMIRLATQLRDDRRKLRSAAALLLTLPGTPFVYYGEEVGLENGPGGEDEWKRTPMPWTAAGGAGAFSSAAPWHPYAPGRAEANVAAEEADPASLLARYRELIRLRRVTPALAHGSTEVLEPRSDGGSVLVLRRAAGDERVLVAHNLSSENQVTVVAVGGRVADTLWHDDGVGLVAGPSGMEIVLPPGASAVWRLASE